MTNVRYLRGRVNVFKGCSISVLSNNNISTSSSSLLTISRYATVQCTYIIRIQRTSSTFSRRKCKWLSGAQDQQTEQKARDSPLIYVYVYITLLITMCIKAVVSLGFILIRSRTVFFEFCFPVAEKHYNLPVYQV